MEIFVIDTFWDKDKVEHKQLVTLEDYCKQGVKKANGSLFELEKMLSELLGKEINLRRDYPEVRKSILNMSGHFSRLPDNVVIKNN